MSETPERVQFDTRIAAVAAVPAGALNLVGLVLHAERRAVDTIVDGLAILR
jgi:hypothetical protein